MQFAMRLVLATGIYPPDIGGPATYVRALAKELVAKGNDVSVITYGKKVVSGEPFDKLRGGWLVVSVSKALPLIRWFLYARALKKHACDADMVVAFSSVSAGVPLWISHLQKPKKILRLGGDFFWERYTSRAASRQADRGGMKSLREWYVTRHSSLVTRLMGWILNTFDHIVFSTRFQEEIYEQHYQNLPAHSVIENAIPSGTPLRHQKHDPLRVFFMGRFVGFKSLPALIDAASEMKNVSLTMVGDGPMKSRLKSVGVTFIVPLHGEEKRKLLEEHDLLVIPSITEISPNVALEARASGLPVLLTQETGLSEKLREGMIVRDLSNAEKIASAIEEIAKNYDTFAVDAAKTSTVRSWGDVAEEWVRFGAHKKTPRTS